MKLGIYPRDEIKWALGLRKWQWHITTKSFREVGTFIYNCWEAACKTWIIHDIYKLDWRLYTSSYGHWSRQEHANGWWFVLSRTRNAYFVNGLKVCSLTENLEARSYKHGRFDLGNEMSHQRSLLLRKWVLKSCKADF